ncbi:MAG: hypothetical protein KAH08_03280 [Methylococcales bacterium]|nr:hypothetical protein [Methylococcales bacterium]
MAFSDFKNISEVQKIYNITYEEASNSHFDFKFTQPITLEDFNWWHKVDYNRLLKSTKRKSGYHFQ